MFSPVGKKQTLLEIKRAKETGLDLHEAREIVLSRKREQSTAGSPGSTMMPSPDKSVKSKGGKKDEDGMGTSKLNQLLADKGIEGTVMRKVMDATVRYNPEKDQIVLKSFQNKFIEPDLFRDILYKAFWLAFSDKEFKSMLDILDPSDSGFIDGYQFMIAFIRLGGIRKEKHAEMIRLENEAFIVKTKEEEAKKKMELEKKNDIAADFDFDDDVRDQAMKKLVVAASKFDPAHPSSPSLEAFNGKYMSAAVLREMLKRVFNLKVSGKELGAILKHFEAKDLKEQEEKALGVDVGISIKENPDGTTQVLVPAVGGGEAAGGKDGEVLNVKGGPSQISCRDFLRQFFRLGVEARDKTARNQRQRQIEMNKAAEEEKARKIKEGEEKRSMAIDFDFSELDVARADQKLLDCSTKYDRNAPGCASLDGFDCESLSVGAFRDLVRRTFGLVLSDKELGYVIRKYDKKGDQTITCKPFLTAFLRIGQDERDKRRLKQLDKQRKLDELAAIEAVQKMKAIQEKSSTFKINYDFKEEDADSAKAKLTEAAVWFDSSRGGSLASFEQLYLSPLEFNRALKRTFNVVMTPAELGAIVTMMDKEGKGHVVSKQFINSFTAMGFQERSSKQLKQIKASKDAEKKMREEGEAKRLALLNKNPGVEIDFEYTEEDRDIALMKMTESALKYDKAHPAAMTLDGFECRALTPVAFKELLRRTFGLVLAPKDAGALIDHFATLKESSNEKEIVCRDFLTVFMQLGYQQRGAINSEQLAKQRRMNKERAEHDAAMLEKTTKRSDGLKVNMDYGEADAISCQAKLLTAAKGYDKNHPAAPSLDAFDIAVMPAGIFRENLKRCFGIILNPAELGYCIATYGNKSDMQVTSQSFLTKFLRQGKAARYEEHSEFLKKQRRMIKEAKEEQEKKLKDQAEGAEFKVDLDDYKDSDLEAALDKMTDASTKFHEPMSSVKGFAGGGPMKPGEFRDLVRRSFGLSLSPQETAALVSHLNFDKSGTPSDSIDSKKFCILFMKLGHQNRAAMKNEHIEKQRQAEQDMEKEKVRKKRLQEQKMTTDIDWDYGEVDRTSVYAKLTEASAKYDKNAPGCVSLTAFEAKFLTPLVYREVMKRTFNIALAPKELAVMVSDFDNGDGNVHCQNFVVYFIKLGADERNKFKLIMLEKQRRDNEIRKAEQDRKLKELRDKTTLKVSYECTDEEKDEAFKKLAAAAKKFDKSHPGSMDLTGFDAKTLPAGAFREMVKRTFGLVLDGGELGAIMSYFDPTKSGTVVCQDFLIHFLRVGQAERDKDKSANLKKLRDDEVERIQREADILAAQWAKTELGVSKDFSKVDKENAIEKLSVAAFKYDSQGSVNISTFHAKYLSAAVFREMLKRVFNVRVTDKELAALISVYEHEDKEDHIDCRMFMNDFIKLGFEARSSKRVAQVVKNRVAIEEEKNYHVKVKAEAESKVANVVDWKYSKQDFQSALEKVTSVAGNYEIGHASAPSLSGFKGANMKPFEFKDMMMRTFAVPLTGKELGALVKYYDSSGSNTVDSKEFLAHFMKLQRQEAEARRKMHIDRERGLKRAEKEKEEQFQAAQHRAEREKLKFTKEDEGTFMKKIRQAAQEYAIDSATMQEPLQAFKGPALNAVAFIDVCRRIFHGMRFAHPEVGVLLSILDKTGTGTIDGPRFLNWFYKLGRAEGEIMLGEREDDITLKSLRAGAASATEDPSKVKIELKPFNQKGKGSTKKMAQSAKSSSGVVLPAAAAAKARPGSAGANRDGLFNESGGGPESNANAAGPRGGKKLALLLMSDKGKHVGGKALDANTDVVVPALPAAADIKGTSRKLGKSQSSSSISRGTTGRSTKKKKAPADDNSIAGQAQQSQRQIDPKHHDVSESKENTGKVSKGTFADSAAPPTASGGGFFFPTLLAGPSTKDGVANIQPAGGLF